MIGFRNYAPNYVTDRHYAKRSPDHNGEGYHHSKS